MTEMASAVSGKCTYLRTSGPCGGSWDPSGTRPHRSSPTSAGRSPAVWPQSWSHKERSSGEQDFSCLVHRVHPGHG